MGPTSGQRDYVKRVLIFLLLAALTALVVWLLIYAAAGMLVIFAGVLGAIFLTHVSSYLARHSSLRYRLSLATVVTLLVLATGGTLYFLGARIAERAETLALEVREAAEDFSAQLQRQAWGRRLLARREAAEDVLTSPETFTTAGAAVRVTATAVAGVVVAIFLAIYFAIRPEYYRNGLVVLVPPARRARIGEILDRIGVTLWWWILGRLAGMCVIGVTSAIGLLLIGIPLAVELGVLAGLLAFIPNFGPVLSVIPPVLLGLEQGLGTALAVVLLYVGLQALEGYLLTPLIEQHQVLLPPGLTLSTQIIFALLFGFLGVFLATPLTVVVYVLIRELYVKDVLSTVGATCDGARRVTAGVSRKEDTDAQSE